MQAAPLLTDRWAKDIKGVLECYDRIVLFGTYKAIGWPGAMEAHLWTLGVAFVDYAKTYANELRLRMADHIRAQARLAGVGLRQVNAGEREEHIVEAILSKRGHRAGLVCVLHYKTLDFGTPTVVGSPSGCAAAIALAGSSPVGPATASASWWASCNA